MTLSEYKKEVLKQIDCFLNDPDYSTNTKPYVFNIGGAILHLNPDCLINLRANTRKMRVTDNRKMKVRRLI